MSEDVAQLVASINEHPDHAHGDYTPAVHTLVSLGVEALPAVLPLLESEDRFTRMRAQRVLEGATRVWVRARAPSAQMSQRPDAAWLELWQVNGSYDWQADAAERASSISKWRAWLDALSIEAR